MTLTDLDLLQAAPGPMKKLPSSGANYYESTDVIRHLNRCLGPAGWQWLTGEHGYEELGDEVWVVGTLKARLIVEGPDGGEQSITTQHTERGWKQVNRKRADNSLVNLGDDFKGADTDALKRAARLLGIGLDAWGKGGGDRAGGQNRPPTAPGAPKGPAPAPDAPSMSEAAREDLTARYTAARAAARELDYRPVWTNDDPTLWSEVQLIKYTDLLEIYVTRHAAEGAA